MPRRCGWLVVVLLAVAGPLAAQRAVATSGLNVRSGHSGQTPIVDQLAAGDTVELLSADPQNDYRHVRTPGGITGWAWAQRLALLPGSPPSPGIDSSWARVASNAAEYSWPEPPHESCAAGGAGGDTITNRWKNRTDSAASYHELGWVMLATLPFPHTRRKHRADWSSSALDSLARFEGLPVSVVGFLSGVKEELPGKLHGVQQPGETTNCGAFAATQVDWHLYLTRAPQQPHYLAIVVESTPRVRPLHPGWSLAKAKAVSEAGDTVRISGWLMFDPEHWDQMYRYDPANPATGSKYRVTLWEIHPVTRIEVRRPGGWIPLDSLP
ncbi:MAG TPA: SH3 domain-containing protein [Gemmatimonadales bacterium]|nr:SH3 domain-containing protein [Gemmatimonadales bacterium]